MLSFMENTIVGLVLGSGFIFNAIVVILVISYFIFSVSVLGVVLDDKKISGDKKILYSLLVLFIPAGSLLYYYTANSKRKRELGKWILLHKAILIRIYLLIGVGIALLGLVIGWVVSNANSYSWL